MRTLEAATSQTPAIALMIGMAVTMGWLSTKASPLALLALLAAGIAGGAILRRPEVGAMVILVLVAVVPRGTLFERGIPLGGGTLKITDLLMVATLATWLVAASRRPDDYPLPHRVVMLPMLGFLVVAAFSLLTASAEGSSIKLGLLELRPLLSYLLVIPLVAGARTVRQLEGGLAVLLAACAISGLELIWKYLHGQGSVASYTGGAIRVDAVFLYPLVAVIWCVVLAATKPSRRLRLPLIALTVISLSGVFFTFQRGAWLAAVVGVGTAVALLPGERRRRLMLATIPVLACLASIVIALNSASTAGSTNPISAGVSRFASLGAYSQDISNRYRIAEWGRAVYEIRQHPVTGIGLGNSITFWSPMYSEQTKRLGGTYSTYYIHNSYIWLALKTGLPGLVLFLAMILAAAGLGLREYWRATDPRITRVLLAAVATIVTVLALSISGPHLTVDNATPLVAAMLAVVLIGTRLRSASAPDAREPRPSKLHAAGHGRVLEPA